jgi:hypothetical protein
MKMGLIPIPYLEMTVTGQPALCNSPEGENVNCTMAKARNLASNFTSVLAYLAVISRLNGTEGGSGTWEGVM